MDLTETPEQLSAFAAMVWAWALAFLPRLGGAILLILIGFIVAGWIARAIQRLLTRAGRVDATVIPMVGAVARYAILILILVAALGQLGVQTASLLAVLGAAGLAIGLALQGTLSNIAAGIMLLWLRPFNLGDYIEGSGVAGTVEELGLFNTQLKTWDGIFKFVPNSQLWNTVLTNYTRNPTRLVLISFGISYEDDIAKGRQVLLEVAAAHPKVLDDPPPAVVPLTLADSSVVLQLRAWAPNPVFWDTRWELTEAGKQRLEAAGITIPFPQLAVHLVNAEAERQQRALAAPK
jgi:small conductance mechanosensitive channel